MNQVKEALKKNTMVIALIIVAIFFTFMTDGALLLSSNITNLIAQNGYVVILAVGMLLCILPVVTSTCPSARSCAWSVP